MADRPSRSLTRQILAIKPALRSVAQAAHRRPFGSGEYPGELLDFFHWGAFAEPTLWGIVYGAWQVIAVSTVSMLLPITVYLIVPEQTANLLSVQLGVMAFSGVTTSIARIWIGMNANRFAWQREAQLVARALSGQPRRDVAWYVTRQWRWILWANVALIITTAITAIADYQTLAPNNTGAAMFALAQHILWPAAAFGGAWLVGGGSFAAIGERLAGQNGSTSAPSDQGPVAVVAESGLRSGTNAPTITVADSTETAGAGVETAGATSGGYPRLALSNGVEVPQVGFGTYKIPPGDDAFMATLEALRAGYRHIDTAALYDNEESVGEAIREFAHPRDELFVTTKVWNDRQGYAETLEAFDESLAKLGTEYVDLYLVHWPIEATLETTWFALEHLLAAGKVRAIGVCNFDVAHLERLLEVARTAPMVNQIELHPRFQRAELVDFCRDRGIVVEAWAPLMRGGVFEIPELVEIGDHYGKSAGQVALRWALQRGQVVLPKSVHIDRIQENFEIWDFELSVREMEAIRSLDRGERVGPDPDLFSWRWPESER